MQVRRVVLRAVRGLTCLLAGLWLAPVLAAAPDLSWLTADERAWLAAHPVVRIGVDPGYAPYAFIDEQGRPQGVSADTMNLLARMLGLRFELVPLPTWADILQAARERRIDLITTATYLPEREEYLAFSRLYIQTPLVVMTRQETQNFASPDAIADLRVALVDGYASTQRVLARYPGLKLVLVKDPIDGLIAVAERRADAYVGVLGVNLYQAQLHGLSNLKVNVGFDLRENGQNLAVRKDWAPLATILSKALDRIPETERLAILNRWLPPPQLAPRPAVPVWSGALAAWLEEEREIRVGVEHDQAPFSFSDPQGQPAGLLVETLKLVQQRAGLRIRWVSGSADELVRHWRAGEVDMLLQQRAITQREPGLTATQPLYQSSYLLVCRRGEDCSGGLVDFNGRPVAVRRGSVAHDDVLRLPQLRLVPTDSIERALHLLQAGEVGAVMGEARSLLRAYEATEPPLTGLQLGGTFGDGAVRLTMAVRSDWPKLVEILNRGLESISRDELAGLRNRWLGPALPSSGLDRAQVLRYAVAGTAAGLMFIAGLAWSNRRLRREAEQRRRAEQALEIARDAAEAASRHKSDFVASTSHELRTPLNAIVGTCHLLQRTPVNEQQARYLEIQANASASLLSLVNDLLDIARIESGKLGLHSKPFELRQVLDDALALAREGARDKPLQLLLEAGAGLPPALVGDAARLQQVLVNLLSNAIKYTPSGTVRLQVRRVEGAPAGSARLQLAVVDTGPGIALALQRRIFEPFRQGDAGGGKVAQGVGLGLAIASALVRQMGGELALTSDTGQGSRFHFELELPLADGGELAGVGAAPSPPQPGADIAGLQVLLVEDNEVNRMIAREVLQDYRVEEAFDGARALQRMAQVPPPQLVLMDLGLPDIDGLEVTRRIRALPGPAGKVPIIGLTARAMAQDRDDCLRAGMQAVVLKPYAPAELRAAMAEVVARPVLAPPAG